jgi:hypothetical protein
VKTSPTPRAPAATERRDESREPLPTWRNTRPRANQETHSSDLARGRERWEAVLGR